MTFVLEHSHGPAAYIALSAAGIAASDLFFCVLSHHCSPRASTGQFPVRKSQSPRSDYFEKAVQIRSVLQHRVPEKHQRDVAKIKFQAQQSVHDVRGKSIEEFDEGRRKK